MKKIKSGLETNVLFREAIMNNSDIHKLTDSETKEIQKCLLNTMKDIDSSCRKRNMTYFLCGGSALGAVRHQGYIPWDDDIDLTMPRKDYDKLSAVLEEDYPDKYWIQDVRTDEKYDLNSMKIRVKGTICQELLDPDPEKAGVFIDIYALEDTYSSKAHRVLHGIVGEGLLLICSCVRIESKKEVIKKLTGNDKVLDVVRKKLLLAKLFSFKPLRQWLLLTEAYLGKVNNPKSEYVSIPTGRKHYFGEMYTRASFFPPKEMRFAGNHFYVMNQPGEYLSKLYGDSYMDAPKEMQREKHAVVRFHL